VPWPTWSLIWWLHCGLLFAFGHAYYAESHMSTNWGHHPILRPRTIAASGPSRPLSAPAAAVSGSSTSPNPDPITLLLKPYKKPTAAPCLSGHLFNPSSDLLESIKSESGYVPYFTSYLRPVSHASFLSPAIEL